MKSRGAGFWFLQATGWLLFGYLVYAQAIPAFDYELGVRMGTQEPAALISDVGVAFWYGFAFADAVFYIPLLAVGLAGMVLGTAWGRVAMIGALGVTVYWPIVCLAAIARAHGADGWTLPNEADYWVVLPLIAAWGLWGLWWLLRNADGA